MIEMKGAAPMISVWPFYLELLWELCLHGVSVVDRKSSPLKHCSKGGRGEVVVFLYMQQVLPRHFEKEMIDFVLASCEGE